MTLQETMNAMNTIKRGKYVPVCFKRDIEFNGDIYTKTTHMLVRFVNYYNIKEVKEKMANNPTKAKKFNQNVKYIATNITYNENTQHFMLGMATTKNSHKKATSEYARNGKEISKEQFDLVDTKQSKSSPTIWLTKRLDDMISIG